MYKPGIRGPGKKTSINKHNVKFRIKYAGAPNNGVSQLLVSGREKARDPKKITIEQNAPVAVAVATAVGNNIRPELRSDNAPENHFSPRARARPLTILQE